MNVKLYNPEEEALKRKFRGMSELQLLIAAYLSLEYTSKMEQFLYDELVDRIGYDPEKKQGDS